MRPQVGPDLRREVEEIVRPSYWRDVFAKAIGLEPERRFESVLPDVLHYQLQTRKLQEGPVPQLAVFFKDDEPEGESLPVLVQVPDLRSPEASYDRLLNALAKSQLRLEEVGRGEAEEIFIDRLSEFLAVQSEFPAVQSINPGLSGHPTIVNSNRSGDTVIYARGYFTSAGTAFGLSTPATGYLSSGRYCFGIIDSGVPRYDSIVWTCPATVRLNLP